MATTNLVTNCQKMKSIYLGTCMKKIISLACLSSTWNELATKIWQKQKETFLLFFCEATVLQRFRNDSLQWIETGCETFR
jgi:hypothetical protein